MKMPTQTEPLSRIAEIHFAAEGETGKEIMEDIEQRIAELLENKITPVKQAVSLEDVNEAIGILGKVEDFVYEGQPQDDTKPDYSDRRDQRRFYRDRKRDILVVLLPDWENISILIRSG